MGPPLAQAQLRLEAVPEMGYDPAADPPRGEVLVKGPGLFNGYHKEETMTKEVLGESCSLYECVSLKLADMFLDSQHSS